MGRAQSITRHAGHQQQGTGMNIVYDASDLVFTGVINGYAPQTIHATGTVTWDPATATGSWSVAVPFQTFSANGAVDLGAWINGSYPSIIEFTPTSYTVTSSSNNDTVQGDIQFAFGTPLGHARDTVSGSFSAQNDFAPYTLTGTVSGSLVPQALPVPEPSTAWMLGVGLVLTMARARRRRRTRALQAV